MRKVDLFQLTWVIILFFKNFDFLLKTGQVTNYISIKTKYGFLMIDLVQKIFCLTRNDAIFIDLL